MHPADLTYALALRLAPTVLRLAAPFSPKLRRGLSGRRDSIASLRRWAERHRQRERPLIWVHAPSVGEGLMSQAIVSSLRAHRPDAQIVFTYFSPSAERIAPVIGADWTGYMPWDRAPEITAALDATEPAAVAFVRTEIWPVLAARARKRGARVVLVNGVLAESSSRLRGPARALLGRAYRGLDAIGAVNEADAKRFGRFGVPRDRVQVTGDARFDQVWDRVAGIDRNRPLLRMFDAGAPWLIAGSTWQADHARLVRALIAARATGATWRAIIAPHEPTDAHVRQLEHELHLAGLRYTRLPDENHAVLQRPIVDVVIVNRVGLLADLYTVGAVAYVGGGFGDAGLHSVVEPAALGLPVVFGPRHGNAQEAERLARAGGAFTVRNGEELQNVLRKLRRDDKLQLRAGAAAREFVRSHTGGAERNAALILTGLPAARGAS